MGKESIEAKKYASEEIKELRGTTKVLPSEAIFMFVAWITTRKEVLTSGSSEDCAVWVDVVSKFCDHNKFAEVRDKMYPHNMSMPVGSSGGVGV